VYKYGTKLKGKILLLCYSALASGYHVLLKINRRFVCLVSASCWFLAWLIFHQEDGPESSVDVYRITLNYIPEDETLHEHRCENLKSCPYFCTDTCDIRMDFQVADIGNWENKLRGPGSISDATRFSEK
jgi:hypothetical protein